MFKIGDIVEITEESDATGMLDFKKGEGYAVCDYRVAQAGTHTAQVYVYTESGKGDWYHCTHFKLKEDTIVEKKECLFKEGQVVWDTSYGRGVVTYSTEVQAQVKFDSQKEGNIWFTQEGVYQLGTAARNRTLFFSEPKIEAATEPLFEPTLEEGDKVVCIDKNIEFSSGPATVIEEDEKFVKTSEYGLMGKHRWDFYRLGEKINFK